MSNKTNTVKAIQAVNKSQLAYCKFLSANDTGHTGSHQSGIYIAKNAAPILFDELGIKEENKEKYVKIRWQDDFTTDARFIYYGKATRNEYRITHFGKGFPYLHTEHTGDLFILTKQNANEYSGYILETEDEINDFLDAFGMSPTDTGTIIKNESLTPETKTNIAIEHFINSLTVDFPPSLEMSLTARKIYHDVHGHEENITLNPDMSLIAWIDMEYHLFRKIESARYSGIITKGFSSIEHFIEIANMVLNRRKSRAGKSLEHHLSAIFDANSLQYTAQPKTEKNKHPDFIFPNETAYHDKIFPSDKLVFLGAKTTCKDRWRQIINEAKRIDHKYLFTLQQGISTQQLDEMAEEQITLVVPKQFIKTYPKEKQNDIWTLKKFINYTKNKTSA